MAPRRHSDYTQEDVSAANLAVYETGARHYDDTVITAGSHARLTRLLNLAVSIVRESAEAGGVVRCLDVAGGTGNASLILDDMDCAVTMIDISPAMVRRFEERCRLEERSVITKCADAVKFLQPSTWSEQYHLIVFSSALHHFRVPEDVIGQTLNLLEPGGIIVTAADPTLRIQARWFRLFSLLDRQTHTLVKDPGELIGKVMRGLRPSHRAGEGESPPMGRIAEYHAQDGMDDVSLMSKVERMGASVLLHKRYTGGYTWLFQWLYRRLAAGTSFCTLISNQPYPALPAVADDF